MVRSVGAIGGGRAAPDVYPRCRLLPIGTYTPSVGIALALIGYNVPYRVQCSITGAAPQKSHAIPTTAFQILKLKRWNHAVSDALSVCVCGELHAKVPGASAGGWALRPRCASIA